jgi:hypothetical protein
VARKKKKPQHKFVIDDAIIPRILEENKYFDESLDDAIVRIEARGQVEWHTVHYIRDSQDKEVAIPLALRIARGAAWNQVGWQIALIAGQRIDGFDFEARFCDIHGTERQGFHRHVWSPASRNALGKSAVTFFNRPGITFQEFIIQALKHMKIFYRKECDSSGNLSLQF